MKKWKLDQSWPYLFSDEFGRSAYMNTYNSYEIQKI